MKNIVLIICLMAFLILQGCVGMKKYLLLRTKNLSNISFNSLVIHNNCLLDSVNINIFVIETNSNLLLPVIDTINVCGYVNIVKKLETAPLRIEISSAITGQNGYFVFSIPQEVSNKLLGYIDLEGCCVRKALFELTFSKKGYKTVTIPFHPMCKETIEALKFVKMEKTE